MNVADYYYRDLINIQDPDGNSLLHKAVHKEDVLEVCKLLESGINPNMFNRYGETPLHICKNEQIAKLLINYGAKLHTKDHFGFTPADRREL